MGLRLRLAGWAFGIWLAAATVAGQTVPPAGEAEWPQWRGPLATGVAPLGDPPARWSETENVRWKIEIPGHGHASPIVWGDRVFVLTAVPVSHRDSARDGLRAGRRFVLGRMRSDELLRFALLAIDRHSGRVVWERTAVTARPHEGRHNAGSWASSSPVTDGDVVCAFFGSRGLHCHDLDGNPLWRRDFGDMRMLDFGEGASPALHGEWIVLAWDHEGRSFIAALDKTTGAERWRTERDERRSWATPLVVEHAGLTQVITSAARAVRGYDFETGALLWEGPGIPDPVSSPVAASGVAYLMGGRLSLTGLVTGSRLHAVDLSAARGDIVEGGAVIWSLDRDTPRVPSPALHEGILYFTKANAGILSAREAATGRRIYGPVRLPGVREIFASPVVASGRLYVTSREGLTLVIGTGPDFEVLARNRLDDGFDASAAVAGDEIYLRGQRYLYRISEEAASGCM